MMKRMLRVLTGLMTVLLLVCMTGVAAASETTLQLTFIGMYANSDGSYTARNLTGSFDVYQDNAYLGTIHADENGCAPMTLPNAENVLLVPAAKSVAEEISVNENGYTVAIVAGQNNIAPVVVYARAGLFTVHTESVASFSLISERGETVMTFSTNSRGDYALPQAIPAGQYTLRMESASLAITQWRDKIINILPYTGPNSIVKIDAEYYFYPDVTLKPATPTPAPTATPAPQVTKAPEQTVSLPDVTPEAPVETAVPTATPTATPVPTHGTLVLRTTGDDVSASFTVVSSGAVCGEGELAGNAETRVDELSKGSYIFTVNLPENVLLTGLNGYPSLQRGTAQWLVTIANGRESVYELELTGAGSVSGRVEGVEAPVNISLNGRESISFTAEGSFIQKGLLPDIYSVTVMLPAGQYSGEGWTFVDTNGVTMAIYPAVVEAGGALELPVITPRTPGSVSGRVLDAAGMPLSGVAVSILSADGSMAASAQTDAAGQWTAGGLNDGAYTVMYAHAGTAIASDAAVLTAADNQVSVSAQASHPAALRVQAFEDSNNNGAWGTNEKKMPGAVITLLTREGGVETAHVSGVTDAEGALVLNAPAGEYILRCELPEDYGYSKPGGKDSLTSNMMEDHVERTQELASVVLSEAGEAQVGIGAMKMATLTGTVWQDDNADGLWQDGEPGVANVRVTAEGVRNGLVYETLTDADGRFEIDQIRNGTYDVTYYVPDGYVFTFKANGPQQRRSLMTTEAERTGNDRVIFEKGETIDEQNVGFVKECVVEGVCFLDANHNGYMDEGEKPLPGVELELFRQSNNKRLRTVTSDENGYFRFGNIRSDIFKVKALLPAGTTYSVSIPGDPEANQFAPRDGRREQSVNDISVENAGTARLLLGAIKYGSVSGVIYMDDNFTGDWETGEKIVSGQVVFLLDDQGETVGTVRTNKNGSFTFDDLAPGSYQLKVNAGAGTAFTKPGIGNVMENAGGGVGLSEAFSIALGQNITGYDIGMITPARVSGLAFADANDNGLYDAGEGGLAGTVVSLMTETGAAESAVVGKDGAFLFDSVLPGRYYLRYELPENGVFSPRVAGGNAVVGEGSNGAGDWFELDAGDMWNAPVCGGLDLGVISGVAFGDSDGSGLLDGAEQPMAGMTLTLTPSRSDLKEMTVLTGAKGEFRFDDLRPDTYTLTVSCPEGYVLSRMEAVTLGLSHGDASQQVKLVVGMGNAWEEQYIGCVKPASYAGYAWLDENLNGRIDDGEKPAAGERISICDQNSGALIAQTETDETGAFIFDGLSPDLYCLRYELTGDVRLADGDTTFTAQDGALVMSDLRIAEGTHESGAILGLVRETTIGGLVWLDSHGTTVPVEGAQVQLLDASGNAVNTCTTRADGRYAFEGLMPGAYSVSVALPQGHAALEPGDRRLEDGALVSILAGNALNTGFSGTINVRMAEHQMALDIGSVLPGRLGDFCWLDLNGNGLQDGDEGGIPGVTIELMRNGTVAATAVSDQYGYYVIKDLYPGEYTLRVTAPAQVKPTVMRTDLPMIVSVLGENGESGLVPVESDGANYDADLGFVLVEKDRYPEGYGEGATQNWDFQR